MRKIFCLLLLGCLGVPAPAQVSGTATIVLFPGVPTGSCTARQLGLDQSNGALYTCLNGSWQAGAGGGIPGPPGAAATVNVGTTTTLTPGTNATVTNSGSSSAAIFNFGIPQGIQGPPGSGTGGGGGLSSFSAGNLSPLFTTSVSNATTAPALSFSFINAPANTMLGNSSTSAGPPSWIAIPAGGGGGTNPLNGCQTPTTGNLVCDNSLSVGATGSGMLQLSYSPNLPAPPTTAVGSLAVDAGGNPNWSVGSSAAWQPLVTSGTLSTVTATMLTTSAFPNCNEVGWSSQTSSGTCADLVAEPHAATSYTVSASNRNHVLQLTGGVVAVTLPAPSGQLAAPFRFTVDTQCASDVSITAQSPGSIDNASVLEIYPCGWSQIWADSNGTQWHAETFQPPGGVVLIQ